MRYDSAMTGFNLTILAFLVACAAGCITADLSGNDKSKPLSTVEIKAEEEACADGKGAMVFEVSVSGESRKVKAMCVVAYSETFTAKSGVSCAITSGMCSGYFPQEKFIVSCDDGQRDSIGIDCQSH